MRVHIHPRITRKRPEITPLDVETAFIQALRVRARDVYPLQWVGVGVDPYGRLLEFIAVEQEPDGWLIFHAMPATNKVLIEVGLKR